MKARGVLPQYGRGGNQQIPQGTRGGHLLECWYGLLWLRRRYVCLHVCLHVYDVHSVHGVWFTCVQFTRVRRTIYTVYGVQCTVYGVQCTVYGVSVRRTVYGVWCTVHGSYFGRAESLF